MDDGRPYKLTDGQRACLRLVNQHMTSKEIARALGISKATVDQRLDRARRQLGAASRGEAARVFARIEGEYDRVLYDPADIAGILPLPPIPAMRDGSVQPDRYRDVMREDQRPFDAASPPPRDRSLHLPADGGGRNDLSLQQRLGWIVAIAIGAALAFGGVIAGLEALTHIL